MSIKNKLKNYKNFDNLKKNMCLTNQLYKAHEKNCHQTRADIATPRRVKDKIGQKFLLLLHFWGSLDPKQ